MEVSEETCPARVFHARHVSPSGASSFDGKLVVLAPPPTSAAWKYVNDAEEEFFTVME
jgi:hypothetical protein